MSQNYLFDLEPSTRCRVTLENGLLVFTSPYDAELVASLKNTIPGHERKWDPDRKVWLISSTQADNLKRIVSQFFHEKLQLPSIQIKQPVKETRLLEVHYIGACKPRDDGSCTAWAWINGEWGAVFTEQVLRDWFEAGPTRPGETSTLYSVLGVKPIASGDEIKTAFRRLARIWHPDIAKEPDAEEQFKKINHAYQLLSDPRLRAKYDVGLALTVTTETTLNNRWSSIQSVYRSPLRCGLIMADGIESMPGKFFVEKILVWEDINNPLGQILASTWPMGAKEPLEQWV